MKRTMLLIMILATIMMFVAGCQSRTIGGDKDEHGCLIAAGYSWCDEKQKCLRTWEENCTAKSDTGIANPASVNCENLGGTLEIVTDADGGQTGMCTLPSGAECEEWALFRGECPK